MTTQRKLGKKQFIHCCVEHVHQDVCITSPPLDLHLNPYIDVSTPSKYINVEIVHLTVVLFQCSLYFLSLFDDSITIFRYKYW